ncbi:MAG TPA: hypothetical protein VI821_00215 [Candidatus Paceibacterota bacterium]
MTKFLPEEIDEIVEYTGLSSSIRQHFTPPYVQFLAKPTISNGKITVFSDTLPHDKQQYVNNANQSFYTTPKTDEKYRKFRTKITCNGDFLTHIIIETPNTLCEIRVFDLEKQLLFLEKFTNEFTFPYAANTKSTEIILLTSNFTRFECETFDLNASESNTNDLIKLLSEITFVPNEMSLTLDFADEYYEKTRLELASMNTTKIRNRERLCAFSDRESLVILENESLTIKNEDILNDVFISPSEKNSVEFYGFLFDVPKNIGLSIEFIRPVNLQRGGNITMKLSKPCACVYSYTAVPGFELPLPGETVWSDE